MFFGEPFGGLIPGALGAVLRVLLRTDVGFTGRQLHGLVSDEHSLWSVQKALKHLAAMGLVETVTIGRAGVHTLNEDHVAVPALRDLVDPIAMLRQVVADSVDAEVVAVVLFGSIARGEGDESSDIDLAVVAPSNWNGYLALQDAVERRLGASCDVAIVTPQQWSQAEEPLIAELHRDGVIVTGTLPNAEAWDDYGPTS